MFSNDALGLRSGRPLGRTLALLATTFAVAGMMLALAATAGAVSAKENPEQQPGSPLPSPEGWVVRIVNTDAEAPSSTVISVSSETIALEGAAGEVPHASGIFPAGCAFAGSSITCKLTVPRQPESQYPTYTEVCYNGSPPGKMTFSGEETIEGVGSKAIVNAELVPRFGEGLPPACGVPGWTPIASSTGSGSGSGSGAPGSNVSGSGSGTGTGTGGPAAAKSWSHTLCKTTYKKWAKKHKHATRKQKKTEANSLHKSHGCPLSLLK